MTTQIITHIWPLVVPGGLPCEGRPTGCAPCRDGADFMIRTTVDAPGELTMEPAQAFCEGHLVWAVYLAHEPHKVTPESVAVALTETTQAEVTTADACAHGPSCSMHSACDGGCPPAGQARAVGVMTR